MGKHQIQIYSLLKEVLNELGDLNNIIPFEFNSNLEFIIPYNGKKYKAVVSLQKDNENILSQFQYDPFLPNKNKMDFFNINLEIEDKNKQAFKSNISLFLRVMYTTLLIIQQELKKYKNSVFVLTADEKDDESKTKQTYYYNILKNNKSIQTKHGNVLFDGNLIGSYFIK